MKKLKTSKWDAAAHLKDEEDIAAYLEAALEENDPSLIAAVLKVVAALGMKLHAINRKKNKAGR